MPFPAYNSGLSAAQPRCLNHAFTVHTKYELAPPYPSFVPKVFLKLDGVVVVNTGDSLVAMSVDIEDNHGGFGFHLYSPRVTRSESTLSSLSSTPSEDQFSSTESHERFSDTRVASDAEPADPLVSLLVSTPCCSSTVSRTPSTPKDATNVGGVSLDYRPASAIRERHASTGKENLDISKQLGSPAAEGGSTPRHETPPSARSHRSLDVYNFEGSTPKKEDEDTDGSPASFRTTLSFTSFQRGAQMSNATTEEINLHPSDSHIFDDLTSDEKSSDYFEKPCGLPRSLLRDTSSSSSQPLPSRAFTASLSLIPPDAFSLSKGMAISPGYNKIDTGSSTCSSCVSSPLILQSESQCFTYSVRRYVDALGQIRPDSPIDIEGEKH